MKPEEKLNQLLEWLKRTVEGSIKKLFVDNTNRIIDTINSQEKTNPQDITNPIEKKLDEVKNSVDNLEFPEYPEQIDSRENIDNLGIKLELLIKEIEKLNPNVTINNDFKEVVNAIKDNNDKNKVLQILNSIKNSIKEPEDYSIVLEEISEKLDVKDLKESIKKIAKTEDLIIIVEYLQAILKKPLPSFEEFLTKDGRIKVEVDRVGQGGGGGIAGSYNADLVQINPATEEKQDTGNSLLTDIKDKQTDGSQKTQITDSQGNAVGIYQSRSGVFSLNIHDAHVHDEVFNHYFKKSTGDSSTLNGAVSKGSYTIVLTSATGFTAGDYIDIKQGTHHIHLYRKILNVSTNTLTLDAPIPVDIADGSTIDEITFNMGVDGSSTVKTYYMQPASDEVLHLERFLITMIHGANVPDDGKFGGITALTRGVHIRINRNNGESYEELTTWKTNQDLKEDMYDVTYANSAPAGAWGTSGRWTISTSGAIIRLDGSNNDKLEILIQDNLSTITDFQIKAQGHFE